MLNEQNFFTQSRRSYSAPKKSGISSAFKMTEEHCGNEQMKLIVGNKQFYFSVLYR